jgi:hypothetical protein
MLIHHEIFRLITDILNQEIDYQKRAKPFHQRKIKMRRKDNKMRKAQEVEYQLPSSQRGNRKDFFKGLDDN